MTRRLFEGKAGGQQVPRPPRKHPSHPPLRGLGEEAGAVCPWMPPLRPGRAALVWGEPLRPLTAAAAAWGVAKEARVLVVDAANRFDPYLLAREARRRGVAPLYTLSRVKVARAFTCHQLLRLLQDRLLRELEPGSLVIVLGPVSLFYDEQVPLAERGRLFRNLTRLLAEVKSQAALLLLQPPLPKGAANQHFGRLLAPMLDYLVEVGRGVEDRGEGTRRLAPAVSAPSPGKLRRERSYTACSRPQRGDL